MTLRIDTLDFTNRGRRYSVETPSGAKYFLYGDDLGTGWRIWRSEIMSWPQFVLTFQACLNWIICKEILHEETRLARLHG